MTNARCHCCHCVTPRVLSAICGLSFHASVFVNNPKQFMQCIIYSVVLWYIAVELLCWGVKDRVLVFCFREFFSFLRGGTQISFESSVSLRA